MGGQLGLFDAQRLKPQTEATLRLLRERGSLTPREARELVGTDRLAARVKEIREVFGYESVLTTYERGCRHARYEWRGSA